MLRVESCHCIRAIISHKNAAMIYYSFCQHFLIIRPDRQTDSGCNITLLFQVPLHNYGRLCHNSTFWAFWSTGVTPPVKSQAGPMDQWNKNSLSKGPWQRSMARRWHIFHRWPVGVWGKSAPPTCLCVQSVLCHTSPHQLQLNNMITSAHALQNWAEHHNTQPYSPLTLPRYIII